MSNITLQSLWYQVLSYMEIGERKRRDAHPGKVHVPPLTQTPLGKVQAMARLPKTATTRKPAPRTRRSAPVPATLLAPALQDAGPCAECAPAAPVLTASPAMSSTLVIAWTECFVCGAEGLSKPASNGRCKSCWEFYRRTGTDRTPEELERTKGLSVDEICSKGLLRQRSATADPAQPRKARTPRATKRVAKTPPAVAPVPTPTASPAPTSAETPAATRDIHTCGNCGKRFYGKARDGRCKVCFDYRKQHGVDRQHTHPTPDIIVGAPTLGQGHVRYVQSVS
jgi:hypothetical protein